MSDEQQLLNTLEQTAQTALTTAQACLQICEQMRSQAQDNSWVSLQEAAQRLGNGISVKMLRSRILNSYFQYGKHYINTSDGERPNYLVRVSSVRKFFETDPAKRPLPK